MPRVPSNGSTRPRLWVISDRRRLRRVVHISAVERAGLSTLTKIRSWNMTLEKSRQVIAENLKVPKPIKSAPAS